MKKFLRSLPLLFPGVLLLLSLAVVGCKEEEATTTGPPPPINTGSANFARYVTIGNSLTAGFQSNALSQRDQVWGFANQIAKHLGTSFEQPLIKDPGIGTRKRLVSLTGPVIVDETGVNPLDPSNNLNLGLQRPYNNLGIPGAIMFDMADTTDFAAKSLARQNPFFALILRNPAFGKSIVAQAKALNPTFITVWIGNNDVLGYASSGGTSGTNAGPPFGPDPPRTRPTEAVLFDVLYRAMLTELKTTNAGIVVGNIPDVTSIPFFTTVPSQGLVLTRQGQVDTLNAAYAPLGITFSLGPNGFIARTGSGSIKKLTPSEFVLLTIPQDSLRLAGWGSRVPIASRYVLDQGEITIVQNAISAFNASIDSLCANRGIGVVNFNSFLATIRQNGLYISGLGTFSPSFITGGLFSYDGVHPSSRGYGIVANEIIKVINTRFSASIPLIGVSSAPGIPIGKVGEGIAQYGSLESLVDLMCGGSR